MLAKQLVKPSSTVGRSRKRKGSSLHLQNAANNTSIQNEKECFLSEEIAQEDTSEELDALEEVESEKESCEHNSSFLGRIKNILLTAFSRVSV